MFCTKRRYVKVQSLSERRKMAIQAQRRLTDNGAKMEIAGGQWPLTPADLTLLLSPPAPLRHRSASSRRIDGTAAAQNGLEE